MTDIGDELTVIMTEIDKNVLLQKNLNYVSIFLRLLGVN